MVADKVIFIKNGFLKLTQKFLESGGPRVIPFVPVIPAGLGGSLSGLGSGLSFVLPGQNQSVIYPPGYSPQTNDTNNKQQ